MSIGVRLSGVVASAQRDLRIAHGTPKIYVKTAESGAKRAHAFCPDCGSPIYSSAIENSPMYSLRVGCLRLRAELPPRKQTWCRSALDWATSLQDLPRLTRQ